MRQIFNGIKISSIFTFLPQNTVSFEEELIDAQSVRNQKIKKSMGYGNRGRVKFNTSTSDLHQFAIEYLYENGIVSKDEIGGVVVTTFTPDYYSPQLGDLLKLKLDLPEDIYTVDIWDGCFGYLNGLFEAIILLKSIPKGKKVLLLTGDSYNRLFENDQFPMLHELRYGGDASSISVLEVGSEEDTISMIIKTFGSDLIEKRGGSFSDFYCMESNNPEIIMTDPRSVFLFFQDSIPRCVRELLEYADITKDEIDGYSVIQANSLAVRKYAEAIGVPYDKMPNNLVERYGDASATINAIALVEILNRINDKKDKKLMIVGYGAGLKYGAALINTDKDINHGIIRTTL